MARIEGTIRFFQRSSVSAMHSDHQAVLQREASAGGRPASSATTTDLSKLTPPSVRLEDVGCPNGCPADDATLFVGRDRLHGVPGWFPVVRCRRCELIRTNPRPTPDTIGAYYPDDYGPYVGTRVQPMVRRKRGLLFRLARRAWHSVVQLNTEVLPPIQSGRMLEIGCASGAYLQRMREQGWHVQGIEFSPTAGKAAQEAGLDVQVSTVEAARAPAHPVDLVVGWMVLEHLHDPQAALSKLAQWTTTGGWLAVSTPNAAALEFRLFKEAGYALHLPAHLYHFTPRTITSMLRAGGWEVERVYHQRLLSNVFAGLGYWLRDRNGPAWLINLLEAYPERAGRWHLGLYPLAWLLSIFGQTGRMTVVARRLPQPGDAAK
jgi:2-polyprenyl-3-methyl-5-hydroxy-6-metoxy-1,4-benzoquinol methylase